MALALLFALSDDPVVLASRGHLERARIEDVEQALGRDPSYKVRVDAALVLGQLRQDRSVPALTAALRDGHPVVRATAAQALGRIGEPAARGPLARLQQQDTSPMVRRMARDALRGIDLRVQRDSEEARRRAQRPAFAVKSMGDQSRKATPALRGYMRDVLSKQLRTVGDVAGDGQEAGFVVDGSIKDLSVVTRMDLVEVSCAVQLVVSRSPGGGVFLLTSGEAVVQRPRHSFNPQQRARMEIEALESAVRGASEDLVQNLARQQ
ncbi:MAG TPA: HEAT repeat domain-containing protein [Polyangia bacterium]|nr:HEAT repeat domain-containing protein [Polyangia bacterium]